MSSGRSGTRRQRTSRAAVLAHSDLCWLCGHPGARTADHVIDATRWPRTPDGRMLPGFDDPANMRPAHGTMGSGPHRTHNPCPTCGKLCNQSRGARMTPTSPRSEDW